jgi:hypothetical protein
VRDLTHHGSNAILNTTTAYFKRNDHIGSITQSLSSPRCMLRVAGAFEYLSRIDATRRALSKISGANPRTTQPRLRICDVLPPDSMPYCSISRTLGACCLPAHSFCASPYLRTHVVLQHLNFSLEELLMRRHAKCHCKTDNATPSSSSKGRFW